MMKIKQNNLDEMQELKLLHIERNGCWLAFWGLLAVILVETVLDTNFRLLAGEWIVFMCLALYLSVSCMRQGIWDRRLRPDLKTNLIASTAAGLVCGIIFFLVSYRNYGKLVGSIATGIFMFLFVFFSTAVVLTVSAAIYKKRVKKLESDEEE